MIGEIVAIFVVFAIFGLITSLVGLFVWRVDPNHVDVWRRVLWARREGRDGPTP